MFGRFRRWGNPRINGGLPFETAGSLVVSVKSGRHLIIDGHNILHAWTDSRLLMRTLDGERAGEGHCGGTSDS